MRVARVGALAMVGFVVVTGCSSGSSTGTTARPEFVCIYASAKCFADMCAGCTAGGYGACPPSDDAFSEVCSEDPTEQNCRDRAVPPEKVSQSTSMTRYTRDVRLLYGIASCAKFRESGEGAATSVDQVCEGNCE